MRCYSIISSAVAISASGTITLRALAVVKLIADLSRALQHVGFVPKATKCAAANEVLFDYFVGGRNQRQRHNYAKGLGGRQVDH